MTDYKDTVYLPKTDFSMRAGLPAKEPQILKIWEDIGLYKKLREQRKNSEPFILHDGPPYANGNLHIGHALNKIIKDVINRSQSMLGKNANYVPGWDCHGLPIEWKIEENYRKKKKNKDDIPVVEFRKECRDFAKNWMDIQSGEFQRLGVYGDWEAPYSTMKYESEARIMSEIGKFLMNGGLYRGVKPVMWSPVEKTALAEAEIEYHDHISTTIFARFPIIKSPNNILTGHEIIIWTTTPWTMPGNRAVAYGKDIDYSLLKISSVEESSLAKLGDKILIASDLLEDVINELSITDYKISNKLKGSELKDSILAHPLHKYGYDHEVLLLEADFVTTDQGTGFVHIAPGHGSDDFELGKKNNLPIPETVSDNGILDDNLPLLGGLRVLKDNEKIADIMSEHGALIGRGTLKHSYPHSWRSKAPLVFRTTPQWFISMQTNDLRDTALKALSETTFYPPQGENRLTKMIEDRPDWCISRQRAWGVPLAIFVNKKTQEPLRDQDVINRIVEAFKIEGADAWFEKPSSYFLGSKYNSEDYEAVMDIADVWFDSGSTHAFVLEDRDDLFWPASLYLEGTDQHRGWFHSSLLESCGTRGRAPYDAVLTHGFVLDQQGRKMSKSLGNITAPQKVINEFGADILRLWVVGSDYYDDLRIGKEILVRHSDHYRRLRNTLRYLLGALNHFEEGEKIDFNEMPELEQWVLHRVSELSKKIEENTKEFNLHDIYTDIHNFCTVDLSAFYFDIRKDTLYCDELKGKNRRSCRTVMDILFKSLTTWLAPIICFTAEEAWQNRYKDQENSVHLQTYFKSESGWNNETLGNKWTEIRELRSMVTTAIEEKRKDGLLGSSLQARVIIEANESIYNKLNDIDLPEIFICSDVEMNLNNKLENSYIDVEVELASGGKCLRCWKIVKEVKDDIEICNRCSSIIKR
ncbi:isoleucine--tRNA ligase [Alphaproteobacteria bacterium]|nr:isoleucine--tRNA ligase [Alphaproteobacteria bacterium]